MPVKLKNDDSIPVKQMADGQIGVIVSCPHNEYLGRVVQRYSGSLVCIGRECGHSWSSVSGNDDFRVRILPPGTLLEIT